MAMGIGQHMTPIPHLSPSPPNHTHTHTEIAVFLFKSMLQDDRLLEILWIPILILSSSYCEHHVQRQKAYIGFLIWCSNSYSKPSRSTPPKSKNLKLIWVFCLRKASYHQQLLLRTIMMHSIDLRTVMFWNLCSNLCFTSPKPIWTSKLLLPQWKVLIQFQYSIEFHKLISILRCHLCWESLGSKLHCLKLGQHLHQLTHGCTAQLNFAKRFQKPEEMSRGKGLGAQAGNEDEDVETWEKGAWRSAKCPFFFLQLS